MLEQFTIFGAQGFIGGRLAEYLEAMGHPVQRIGRDDGRPEGDLGHVVYAIGLTADFRSRSFATIEAHVSLIAQLLEQRGFESLLYLSSTRVYQHAIETTEDTTLPVRPLDPSDLYNISKVAGESICLSADRPNVRVARLSNIVGPGEATRDTFIGALCREAILGQITLQSAATSAKDYLFIDDALPVLSRIALRGQARIYNVASGIQIRHAEWAQAIATATKASWSSVQDAPDGGFPPISTSRVMSEFRLAPSSPIACIDAIIAK